MKTARSTVPVVHAIAVVLVLGLLAAACGGDNSSTTAPTVTGASTEVFEGTLAVQGSSFYSFTVATSGQVSITLASLVAAQPGPAVNNVLGLGVGTPLGTDCSLTNSVMASPGLTAQLVNSLTAATYCVRIYDLGSLSAPVNFAVRIVHP
jgi:hypothetical protein